MSTSKMIRAAFAVTLFLLLVACDPQSTAPVVEASNPAAQEPADQQEPDPGPEAEPELVYEPKPKDFEITLKVLSKECFGSAGCLLEVRPELAYDGPPYDPDVTYELTYEIAKADLVDTMEITGDDYTVLEHRLDIPDDKTPKVEVTAVEPQ